MSATRVIKKYPNRRLYDTGRSSYITLSDVRQLINARVSIEVREQRTGADLTHDVLLQVIAALETQEPHLLTRDFLMALVRAYSDERRDQVTAALNRALGV